MKPNNRSNASGAGTQYQDASLQSAQLTAVSDNLEPSMVAEELGPQAIKPPQQRRPVLRRAVSLAILGVGILAAVLLALHMMSMNKHSTVNATQADKSALLKAQTIPLSNLGLKPIDLLPEAASQVTVNGNVDIVGTLYLGPSTAPTSAVAGQLYFDQSRDQVAYYNGKGFVYLQGGGTPAASSTTNITNVTNVTNNYGTTGITAINGTAGSIAMFDGSGALTESMITQSGSTLSTGTGVENVTIGSTSGTSNTIVQGGLGNVAINTGAVTGTSGTITIESGASSTTAAGDVTVDTGESIINGTLIADKTFEDGTDDNMGQAIFGDNSTTTVTTAQAHSGTHSIALSVGSNFFPSWGLGDGADGNPPYKIRVVAGHTYALEAWVRAGTNSDTITASANWSNDGYGGGGFISQQTFGTVTDTTTGWQKVAGVLTAPVGSYAMGFGFSSSNATSVGEVHYFDDITLTDLTTAPSEAALNLGTTNAQVINIGNSGMLAPTSIYGSGINLAAGAGFLNATSTYMTLSGSTGGSISTGTGALSLVSGTSASWGIAGGLVGGSLTLHGGSSGGNNNGGDLILQSGEGSGTGSSGNILMSTSTANGTTGSSGTITLQTGDSSTTAAGNINVDTGHSTITGTQVDNLTFESSTQSMNMWGGSGSVTQDCTQAHTGTCSLNITGFSSVSAWEDSGDIGWTVTPGHTYAFSFWVKAASTAEPVSGAVSWNMGSSGWTWSNSPTITDTSTGWTQVTWTATAPAGAQFGDFELGNISGPGTTHYFDDVVATDMSSGSSFSSLNLGTANAQGVNIGNVSQINPTTIDGGGISLTAGQGNFTISGGATTITAAADASLTSTGGVLTLSGEGGSSAGVVVKPVANSATAFVAQAAGGASILSVDTTGNGNITIGSASNPATITFIGGATSSRPASPTKGQLYYDTSTNQLIQYNGTKWVGAPRTATKIVAASNSSQAAKDAADFVATGSDDATTINAALSALPAGGGLVYLEEGTYTLGATSIRLPDNTTLDGAGTSTVLQFANAVGSGSYYAITNSDTTSGTNIAIQNLLINGNNAGQTTGTFYGIYLNGMGSGSGSNVVPGAKVSAVTVENIYSAAGAGIYLNNSLNNILTNNNLLNNFGVGLFLNSASSNNVITSNSSDGNNNGYLFQGNSNYNTANGNTAQGNNYYGIQVYGSNNNTVTNNTVSGNNWYGVYLTGAVGNNVSTNKVYDNGGAGQNNGIFIEGGSTNNQITNNNITDSSCSSSCYAININDTNSIANYFSANTFAGDGTHLASIRDNTTGGNSYANQSLTPNGDAFFRNAVNSANAFQVQNSSGGTTMLNVGTSNTQAINDNLISSAPTGTFVNSASWVSGQYVELDNGGPGIDGELNYQLSNVGYSFNSTFDFWSKAGGGDGTFLYAYGQRPAASFHLGAQYGGGGYVFAYADAAQGSYAAIYYDGTQLASAPISASDTSSWHTAQVTKVGNAFTMYMDGSSVLTYTDAVARDISGTNFGVGGCSCSYNGEHRVTNLVMSGDPFVTTGGSAQLGGNVAIAGSLTTPAINTNQISMASSLTIKPWSNSTSAFTIQSAYDATLFAVDTTNAVITISAKLQVNGNLTLNGHFQTSGTTPTIAAGAAACTSPTVSISGNDTSGTITVTAGSSCASTGALATITFASAFGAAPHVLLTSGAANAAGLNSYVDDSTVSTNSFVLGTSAIPTSGTTYKWNYLVVQ